MSEDPLKVGEVARRTGLTVRTLHHYDEIGLLRPSLHTESGHRLYAAADLARLQQIKSLRQLGFSLEEIRTVLDRPDYSPLGVIEMHVARLKEQIGLHQRLCERLEGLASSLRATEAVSVETLLETIEVMSMFDKYYTPEQMEYLRQRKEQVGEERIQQVQAEWQTLYAQLREEMERGADPASEPVQALARKASSLIEEFTGGDSGIRQSLSRMYQDHPTLPSQHGMPVDQPLMEYFGKAMAHLKQGG